MRRITVAALFLFAFFVSQAYALSITTSTTFNEGQSSTGGRAVTVNNGSTYTVELAAVNATGNVSWNVTYVGYAEEYYRNFESLDYLLSYQDPHLAHFEIQSPAYRAYLEFDTPRPQPQNNPRTTWNGHTYELIDEGMTWDEARTACEAKGGYLAIITSQAEQEALSQFVISQGKKNSYWLGGEKDSSDEWHWLDGTAMSYTHWADGQPDNHLEAENKLMMYREINPIYPSEQGTWNDLKEDCTCEDEDFFGPENFGYICEYDTTESKRYEVFNENLTWTEAKARCEALGGHLATITSQSEQDEIEALMLRVSADTGLDFGGYWLGGRKDSSENFRWITGEEWQYTNFDPIQPDGSGDFLQIFVHNWSYDDFGFWDDTTNDGTNALIVEHGFICEYDGLKSDTTGEIDDKKDERDNEGGGSGGCTSGTLGLVALMMADSIFRKAR